MDIKKNVIAIDLGSNSIRLLKMDCRTKKMVGKFHKIVKTADGLASTGCISYSAFERIIRAIEEAKEKICFANSRIIAVTTEAIRSASNGQEILDGIYENTNIKFTVIDGTEEAKYALIATKNRLNLLGIEPKSFVLVDIGGGSTELILSYKDKVISKSFQIGIVTLTESFNGVKDIENVISYLMQDIKIFYDDISKRHGNVEKFIAMAGTPTTVASMKLGMTYKTYDGEKINGTIIKKEDLQTYLNSLITMSLDERAEIVGIGKEELITSGILIYREIFNITGFDSSIVIDDGVREGVALRGC